MAQTRTAAASTEAERQRHTIRIQRVAHSRAEGVELTKVPFSSVMSDHMLLAEYRDGAWQEPSIVPYGPLPLSPAISALQYGISAFEGMKAHRSPAGDLLLFRPWENARRLNRTAARLAMQPVPEAMFLEGLKELLRLDDRWVPPGDEGALYIRPALFSIDESIRVKPADRFYLVIFTFPFGSYFAAPVDVLATEKYVRAFPGGSGNVKPGGNYATALIADQEARDAGFSMVMWLDGLEHRYVEECGVMNVFFVLDDRVITPALSGTILPGITRDSVITLLRDAGHTVEERRIGIDELVELHRQGRLRECFGTGTAAVVSPVQRIRYRDTDIALPPADSWQVAPEARNRLVGIATGRAPDPYGWVDRI